MIYLKSALAGIAAVFALAILTVCVIGIYLWIAFRSAGNGVSQWESHFSHKTVDVVCQHWRIPGRVLLGIS